jgi:putative ABC transport system permease protein
MRSVCQDLSYGLRILAKNPAFGAVSVFALALGIGANTAIYSVADVLLFRPLMLPDLDRLVVVAGTVPGSSFAWQISPADLVDFREQNRTLDHVSAYVWWAANLTGDGEPERVQGFRVTSGFFNALAQAAARGRTLLPGEEEPGRERVVVLSYALWQRRFGADPNVVGRVIQVNGQGYEVVGVMPKDFRYPAPAELWAPLPMSPAYRGTRGAFDLYAIARLKPSATLGEANAELEAIARRLSEQHPQTHARRGARAALFREWVSGEDTREYTLLLLGSVLFVLPIACANVANLQFARASARRREMGIPDRAGCRPLAAGPPASGRKRAAGSGRSHRGGAAGALGHRPDSQRHAGGGAGLSASLGPHGPESPRAGLPARGLARGRDPGRGGAGASRLRVRECRNNCRREGGRLPVGQAIEELVLVCECSQAQEWDGVVRYLPL